MERSRFDEQLKGFRGLVLGFYNWSKIEEWQFADYQAFLLNIIKSAVDEKVPYQLILSISLNEIELLIKVAERDDLPLSLEFEDLLKECLANGIPISRSRVLPRSKPLSSFPNEPPVIHSVFVDESGTPSFNEIEQPVLSIVGVLVKDAVIDRFSLAAKGLLLRYKLNANTEFHAYDCISGKGEFEKIADARDRFQLLKEFVQRGINHILGIHYMSMLKPIVAPDFKLQLKRLNLDAYTSSIIWFNVTFKVACIRLIGLQKYHYYFDRTDKYRKSIRKILYSLKKEPNLGIRIHTLEDNPVEVDSANHRFIQLADVTGYFLTRYRQFEIRKFKPSDSLLKHESEVRLIFDIIKPKVMSYTKDNLWRLIDWNALQNWSP
jgi:hypothetical protein